MKKLILISIASIQLSACSTLATSLLTKPVVEDEVSNYGTLSLTADRRIAVFNEVGTGSNTVRRSCAEAQPDVAVSRAVTSEVMAALEDVSRNNTNFNLEETLTNAITVAYQRTERSDLVRQLGWQLCQAYMNDGISTDQYAKLLSSMVYASLVNPKADGTTDTKTLNETIKRSYQLLETKPHS